MNVGVLNLHFSDNYGAVLQAYGFCKTIESLGASVEQLDYLTPARRAKCKGYGIRHGRAMRVIPLRWKFDQFRRRFLPLSRQYRSPADLRRDLDRFDVIVVGSDQVWNVQYMAPPWEPVYFMDIALDHRCKLISYAACFGHPDQPAKFRGTMKKCLESFDAISVRGRVSQQLFKEITGRTCSIVADPTLLHNFSDLPAGRAAPVSSYVLVYGLEEQYREYLAKTARTVAEALELPIVSVSHPYWDLPLSDFDVPRAGPCDWLTLIRKSAFVVTDSFHGTVFSLKLHRPFLACTAGARRHRLQDFLDGVGLLERLMLDEPDTAKALALASSQIDFESVDSILAADANAGRAFLSGALGIST